MEVCLTNEAKVINCKELEGGSTVKANVGSTMTEEQIKQLIKEAKIIYWKENDKRLY